MTSILSISSPPPILTHYDPIAALPEGYPTVTFSNFKKLALEAQSVSTKLEARNGNANQYILILNLSEYAKNRLKDEADLLGVPFRFEWDGNMGIVKVLPKRNHESPKNRFQAHVDDKFTLMGIPRSDREWGGAGQNEGNVSTKGKQPDQKFQPPSRFPAPGQQSEPWPTLVIETGASESLQKLREDALWWFNNSNGDVRIVILLKVNKSARKVWLEQWQLALANSPRLTRAKINDYRQQNPLPMPPLVQQPFATQQAFALQEIEITPTSATGQLVLPFWAVFDRAPTGIETDLIITPQELTDIARFVF